MKPFITSTIAFFFAFHSYAQINSLIEAPPPGKGRIVFIYAMYEDWQRVIVISKAPVFMNGVLICRVRNKHYIVYDAEPGLHILASQESGKKLNRKTPATEVDIASGGIYYFELEGIYNRLRAEIVLTQRRAGEARSIIERKRAQYEKDCGILQKPLSEQPLAKKFFVRIPVGLTFPSGDMKNWWPAAMRAEVNRFNRPLYGIEAGVRLGKNNHLLSWAFSFNPQQRISTPPNSEGTEQLLLRYNALYYSYILSLDKKNNRLLLHPKIGFGGFNYVFESRGNTGGGSQGVGRIGGNAAILLEYRITPTISVDGNWEYLMGHINFNHERIVLNQQRIYAGVRVAF